MKLGQATGLQIAFFTFAILLLAVPASDYAAKVFSTSPEGRKAIGSVLHFVIAAIIVFGVAPLRRHSMAMLRTPVPAERRWEVGTVTIAKALLFALATAGGVALWNWSLGGAERLSHRVSMQATAATEMANALSASGFLRLALVSAVAPVMEEIVFRGFLYRAWERRWGWAASTLLTSAVFALYHASFFSSFVSSVLFVAIYRRTGSLRAPIAVHAAYNFALWYPLLGQAVFPRSADAAGNLSAWWPQLSALGLATVLVPWYVWLSRRPYMAGNERSI